MRNLKQLSLSFDVKADDDSEGTFEGHASIFGKEDLHGDIVEKGAFKKSLRTIPASKVKMLRGHDVNSIIGVWQEVKEDSQGLFVKGKLLLGIEAAKETFLLMKEGVLDSMSIGFRTIVDEFDSDTMVRTLKEIKLLEISLVTFPAQPDALVSSVKDLGASDLSSKSSLECALRDAGFSVSTAKYICAGWTPPALRNAGGTDEITVDALKALSTRIRIASGIE